MASQFNFKPPLTTSIFSTNSHQSPSQFNQIHTNFSTYPKLNQKILHLQSSTVCAASINPPSPPSEQNRLLSNDVEVSLEAASVTRYRRKIVRVAWEKLVWWCRSLWLKARIDVLEHTNKIYGLGFRTDTMGRDKLQVKRFRIYHPRSGIRWPKGSPCNCDPPLHQIPKTL